MEIVGWWSSKVNVIKEPKNIYEDRLTVDFDENKGRLTLKIVNAKYNDSGKYFLEVQLKDAKGRANDVVTLNVHGMFFSCC